MKRSFLLCLLMAFLASWVTVQAEETLTVNDGTTSNLYVPLYGYYADTNNGYQRSQFIVSADDLSDMANGQISGLSFYASSDFAFTATWEVKLLETSDASVSSSYLDVTSATTVYSGAIQISNQVASVVFSSPFNYVGENLLIEVVMTAKGNCSTSSSPVWYGVSGNSRGSSGYNTAAYTFVPKVTFTYEPGEAPACAKPRDFAASEIAATSVKLSWTEKGEATAWQIMLNDDEENLIAADANPFVLDNGLTAETAYSVKVRAYCSETEQSDWSNEVNFTTEPTCPKPTVLSATSGMTVFGFCGEFTWSEIANADHYEVSYSVNSDFSDPVVVIGDEEDEYIGEDSYFEGASIISDELEYNTIYYVRVRAICGVNDESQWSDVISFKTQCAAVTEYPWSENFDEVATSTLPDCWGRINTSTSSYSSYPYVTSGGKTGNGLYFYTYSNNGSDQYAVLPQMSNLGGKRIVFWAKGYNTSSKLKVGRMTNPEDASTFVQMGEDISLTTDFAKYIVTLEGEGDYIAFEVPMSSSSYTYTGAYIDDITVEEIPDCLEVGSLSFVSSATNSAVLNWNASESGEEAWDIYYSTENVAPTAETEPSIAGTSAKEIPSGLNASTTYYVWVRANCGTSHGAWSEAISFETKCEAVVISEDTPWSENFDSYSEYSTSTRWTEICWKNEQYQARTGSYGSSDLGFRIYKSTNGTNSTIQLSLPDMGSGEITDLTLPEMNIPAANEYEFMIDVYRNADGTSYPQEGLRILAVQGEESTELGFIARNITTVGTNVPAESEKGWYTYNFTIPYGGNVNIVVRGESKYGSATYFDNLKVREIPSCIIPASIAEPTNITASSATFAWEAGNGETDFQYVVVPAGEEPSWISPVAVIGANTVTVETGLEANTAYDFYVRANCGADQSEALSISFRTACEPFDAATWAEDFEDGIYCWTVGNKQSESSSYIPYCSSSAKMKGENGLYMYAYKSTGYYGTNADSAYAVLPEMNYGEKSLKDFSMSFYAKAGSSYDSYNKHLYIGVVSDPADLSTFTQVADVEVTTDYAQYEIDFAGYTGEGQRIVLLAVIPEGSASYLYGQFYIDDMEMFATPTCQPLRSILISDIERRSMIVNLIPKAGLDLAANHELVYSTAKLDEAALEAADKIAINDTNKYLISGLERGIKYYIYVRANCGSEDGVSAWVCDSAKTQKLEVCEGVIGDGTSTAKYPFTNYNYSYSQTIYTADNFQYSGDITSIYLQRASGSEQMDNIKIYLGLTDKIVFSGSSDWIPADDLTLVYDGSIAACEDKAGEDEIIFDTPFAFDGQSNLVLAISNAIGAGNYSKIHSYYYSSVTGTYLHRQNDNDATYANYPSVAGTLDAYRANVRFGLCNQLPACPAVTNISSELLGDGTSKAAISWEISGADYLSGFDVILSDTAITDFEGVDITAANHAEKAITFDALTASTTYYVYVRAICQAENHDEGNSEWVGINFTTLANCPAVINLALSLGATDSIMATWDRATLEQDKAFRYIISEVRMDEEALAAATPELVEDTVIGFAGLAHEMKYYFYVASACGEQTSAYVEDSIETLPACQVVENLVAARTKHNLVELTWTSAQFASETQWEVGILNDETKKQIVSERKAIIFGLTAETAYSAYVKAICGEESASAQATVDFTTEAQPGNCAQVGKGTSTVNYIPVGNYYNYSYSQQIFDASELQKGTITAISFQYAYATAMTKATDVTIYLGVTDKSTFSSTSDWVALSELTQVYQGTLNCSKGWNEFTLQTPFNYNGSGNLVVAVDDNAVSAYDGSSYTFYVTTGSDYKTLYYQNDNNTSPASNPRTGNLSAYRNNIQFCFEAKACPDVTALAVSDITTSSAKVTWEPMGSEMAWNVFKSTSQVTDFSEVTAERVETLSKSFVDLDDDADYFVYVQPADCDGAEFSMISFRTVASCKAMVSPAVVSDSIKAHTARVTWVDPNEVKAGNYTVVYAKFNDFDLADPMIATVQVTDTFADLEALQADTVYKFAVKANCGGDDDSRYSVVADFTTLQSCFTPTAPAVLEGSITAHEATVYWKDAHDDAGYIVAYGPYETFNISNPETYQTKNVEDTFALLDGLNASTRYAFCVKGDCSSVGEGESKSWTYSVNFYTACEDITTLPWVENFNSLASGIPACWDNSEGTTTTDSYKWNYYATGYEGAGLRFNSYSNSEDNTNILATPTIVLSEDAQLEFAWKNPAGGAYKVQIAADGGERVDLKEDMTGQSEWMEETIDLSAYNGHSIVIYFCATSNWGNGDAYLYLDEVAIRKISSCKRPATIDAEVLSATSAAITWTAGGDETNFQVACVRSGEEPNWDNAELVAGLTLNIDTLSIDNDYDFYVRAYCDETEQSEARVASAHVGYCTPAPTSVDNNGIVAIAFNGEELTTANHPTSSPYYTDNTTVEMIAHPNESDSIQITYQTGYTYGTVIWVDWNNNLTFDASEVVFKGESTNANPTTLSCVFQIPAETALGAYRMRIGGADSFFDGTGDPNPCGTGTYTIYEDFTLRVAESAPAVYTVTFAAEGAEGIVPAAQTVEAGQSVTMPVNKTLYMAAKTLTAWSDGTNSYAANEEFTPTADVTLNAIFTDNTVNVLSATEEVIVKWYFGESNGAPSVHWEGNAGLLVAQTTIGSETIDVKLAIDATNGKFFNAGRGDQWAQVNAGTIFTFPYKAGMTYEAENHPSYPNEFTEGVGTLTVPAGKDSYYSYLQITLPATPSGIGNTGVDAKAIKRLENGVLVIELNGTKYNAQGALIRK